MKAAVYRRYGSPAQISIQDIPVPTPGPDEVLVKIHATSLNGSDWEFLTGKPLYARVMGLFRPRYHVLGSDIAGTVEAVGKDVTRYKAGDAVFGDIFERWGGLAEYVSVPASMLLPKPEGLTFVQAAALPQAGVIALQGLRDKRKVQAGDKVLINGAGGSAGTFAIQLAKSLGAEVTGVDNAGKQEFMRELGADHVLDYQTQDFSRQAHKYDLILDMIAKRSVSDYKRALAPEGSYALVGGTISSLFQVLLFGAWGTGKKKLGILAFRQNHDDQSEVARLCESGQLTPVIDTCYPLEESAAAFSHLGEGRAKGKIVVTPIPV